MATGICQRSTQVFARVTSTSRVSFPECENNLYDCQYTSTVFADGTTDEFKNDKTSILGMFEAWTSGVVIKLQKLSAGTYSDLVTIANDDLGEYYHLGYWTSKPYYAGVVLYWKEVYATYSTGTYRISFTETNPTGTNTTYSKPYCLKAYGCGAADNTVRLEWWLNKGIGDIDNDQRVLDYSTLNWYSQIRLPQSFFGYPKSSYETETIQYSNGQIDDIKNIQTEKYILKIGLVPAWVHNIVKTYACQADTLKITDYSPNNPQQIVEKAVRLVSAYEPRWSEHSKCASVRLEFEPKYSRLERFKCL